MVSAALMALALLAFLSAITQAYHLSDTTRHREQARALLQSQVDAFIRLPIYFDATDKNLPVGRFSLTTTETGEGLQWTGAAAGDGAGLKVRLGADPTNPTEETVPEMTITREVHYLKTDGTINTDSRPQDALANSGRLMVATFRGKYKTSGRSQTETLTIVRASK